MNSVLASQQLHIAKQPFKRQFRKMVKHTQTIRRQIADELCVFDHFVGLALKGLKCL